MNSTIESLTKLIAAAGIAFYVSGLVVTNLYLRIFGFSDFSLIRTRYVLTGVTALGFLVGVGGLLYGVWRLLSHSFPIVCRSGFKLRFIRRPIERRSLRLGLWFLSFGFFLTMILSGLLNPTVSMTTVLRVVSPGAMAALTFWYAMFLVEVAPITPARIDRVRRLRLLYADLNDTDITLARFREQTLILLLMLPIGAVMLPLLYFTIYASSLYAALPEQFGGGRARSVQFVVAQEFVEEAASLGLHPDPVTFKTNANPLIWESETQYLVALSNGAEPDETIQVDKRLIVGIIAPIPGRLGNLVPPLLVVPSEERTPPTSATPIATP